MAKFIWAKIHKHTSDIAKTKNKFKTLIGVLLKFAQG